MAEIADNAERMLETDCGHSLEELARKATDKDMAQLIKVVEDAKETPARKTRAVFVLGRLEKKEALQPILNALAKLDEGGRIAAADALGRLGGAKARSELIKLSSDSSAQTRKFAARALARIGDKTAVDRLKQIAEDDAEGFVRRAARKQIERAK